MQIFIRDLSGKVQAVEVKPEDTIEVLQRQFSKHHNFYCSGKLLLNLHPLSEYGIVEESVIHAFQDIKEIDKEIQIEERKTQQMEKKTIFNLLINMMDHDIKNFGIEVHIKDTIKQLKEKCNIIDGDLWYSGISLDNNKTIEELNIPDQSILIYTKDLKGGGIPITFSDVSQVVKGTSSPTAPNYRIYDKGISIEGICNNKNCQAYSKKVLKPYGFGEFNMNKMAYESVCPLCMQELIEAINSYFHLCKYTVDARFICENGKHEKVCKEFVADDKNGFSKFLDGEGNKREYVYLTIKVEEINK